MHEMHLNQNHKSLTMEWIVRYIPIPMLQKKFDTFKSKTNCLKWNPGSAERGFRSWSTPFSYPFLTTRHYRTNRVVECL